MSIGKAAGTAEGLDTPRSTAETAGEAVAVDPAVAPSTSEVAKRALAVVRGNRKILRRIMDNEMLYRGDL